MTNSDDMVSLSEARNIIEERYDMVDGDGERAMRTVIALHARVAELTRERDEARAIIEGRPTPPTDEECIAHERRECGLWMLSVGGGVPDIVFGTRARVHASLPRGRVAVRWWPIDEDGRPCAWPVVTR